MSAEKIRERLSANAEDFDGIISDALALIDRLTQEAQIHAQGARTANATIAEIYRAISGGRGEPGNWHGAEPVREFIQSKEFELAHMEDICYGHLRAAARLANALTDLNNIIGGMPEVEEAVASVTRDIDEYKGRENTQCSPGE